MYYVIYIFGISEGKFVFQNVQNINIFHIIYSKIHIFILDFTFLNTYLYYVLYNLKLKIFKKL